MLSTNHIQPQSIAIIENPSPSQRVSAVLHTQAHITGITNINIGMSPGPGGAGGTPDYGQSVTKHFSIQSLSPLENLCTENKEFLALQISL